MLLRRSGSSCFLLLPRLQSHFTTSWHWNLIGALACDAFHARTATSRLPKERSQRSPWLPRFTIQIPTPHLRWGSRRQGGSSNNVQFYWDLMSWDGIIDVFAPPKNTHTNKRNKIRGQNEKRNGMTTEPTRTSDKTAAKTPFLLV